MWCFLKSIFVAGCACRGRRGCEVFSSNGATRTVLLARIPRRELPEAGDPVKLGQAYLGRV